jgi:hypothetical protein
MTRSRRRQSASNNLQAARFARESRNAQDDELALPITRSPISGEADLSFPVQMLRKTM